MVGGGEQTQEVNKIGENWTGGTQVRIPWPFTSLAPVLGMRER